MGIELVKAVSIYGAQLTGAQFKVLNFMAMVALDHPNGRDQRPGLYYGGWEPLERAVGGKPGSRSAHETVRRATSDLVALGYIERLGRAGPNNRQTYRLHLRLDGIGEPIAMPSSA